ncbi:MAG: hypothetical protein HY216_10335 [Candidatus Rokubacteria bacterium]|nr:hypothetical protein [Candidatus Rokubacteria bacterium]
MDRRQFLTLAAGGATMPLGIRGLDAPRARVVKRLNGVDELLVHFEDGAAYSLELKASGIGPEEWDGHEANIRLRHRHVDITVDPRVTVEHVLEHRADACPGSMWVAFPYGACVTITETIERGTLAVVVEPKQEA